MFRIFKMIIICTFIVFLFLLNTTTITNVKSEEEYKNFTVFIDPGHGGIDGGASGNGVLEKEINLKVALYLRNYLEEIGINVLMTREEDIDYYGERRGSKKRTDLQTRIDMINESNCNLYVSIHMNKIGNSKWSGSQVFYYPGIEENELIAKSIQKNLINILKNTDREAKPLKSLYLFRNVNKPGVLIEAGFVSNPLEANLLKQNEYQQKLAQAIFYGILQYLNEEKPTFL